MKTSRVDSKRSLTKEQFISLISKQFQNISFQVDQSLKPTTIKRNENTILRIFPRRDGSLLISLESGKKRQFKEGLEVVISPNDRHAPLKDGEPTIIPKVPPGNYFLSVKRKLT